MDNAINDLARTIVEGLPECWGDQVVDGQVTINLTIQADILDKLIEEVQRLDMPHCRICGCTDDNACPGGCYWVEEDLCSKCVEIARLQDAAPKMLEALERSNNHLKMLHSFTFCPDEKDSIQSLVNCNNAAIAKAKGKSHEQV